MTQITYSGLTPNAPENVNDLNTKLIEIKTVVNGNLDSGNLAAASVGTSELVDGSVTAAKLASAVGAPLAVASQVAVGNTGQAATGLYPGRILAATDFTGLGLSAPVGLYNLSSTADSSGNGRTLTNKGTVTFDTGITGSASTAALFTGSTAQALYIVDTGAADPFRIKTGTVGGWVRTAKRGTDQDIISKWNATVGIFLLEVTSTNVARFGVATATLSTVNGDCTGITDVADDRWHYIVGIHDGTTARLYVDGVLECSVFVSGPLVTGGSAPLNIGGFGADAGTAATRPNFGRIDESFITADVLSDDQVRFLYCSKIAHAYPATPKQSWVQVRRQRRGADLATTDFPATPVRLYAGGSLVDLGSGATNVVANNTPVIVAGPDGVSTKGYNFVTASTQSLSATDTGLPSGTNSRSYGLWIKTSSVTNAGVMGWGTLSTNDARLDIIAGVIRSNSGADSMSGPYLADGLWHLIVVTEENSPTDGVKRKMYVDGRLVVGSVTLTSLTLAGANRFRIGANMDATAPWTGQAGPSFVTTSVLTPAQVQVLYDKSSQQLTNSPKNEGDHIEGMDATYLYLDTSGLPSNSLVDIQVQG